MTLFLILILIGFSANVASAFTSVHARLWGMRRGSWISAGLRSGLGIPCLICGFALAVRMSSPMLFTPTCMTNVGAVLLIAFGSAIVVIAFVELRTRTIKPSDNNALACNSVYKYVRHPMHTGLLIGLAGLCVLRPTGAVGLACGVGVAWIFVQTLCEEADLQRRVPGYRAYMRAVPRFVPRLRTHRAGERQNGA
jgi:protein-S-isoprenylcysteine O-methyltransferase Ste14